MGAKNGGRAKTTELNAFWEANIVVFTRWLTGLVNQVCGVRRRGRLGAGAAARGGALARRASSWIVFCGGQGHSPEVATVMERLEDRLELLGEA